MSIETPSKCPTPLHLAVWRRLALWKRRNDKRGDESRGEYCVTGTFWARASFEQHRSRSLVSMRNGSELDHIRFIVDDAVKWFNLSVKRGAKPAAEPFGHESETLAYVKDPSGIWIKLIGPGRSYLPL